MINWLEEAEDIEARIREYKQLRIDNEKSSPSTREWVIKKLDREDLITQAKIDRIKDHMRTAIGPYWTNPRLRAVLNRIGIKYKVDPTTTRVTLEESTSFEKHLNRLLCEDYEVTGKDVGPFYHAGRAKIKKINPSKLGERDEGWYGSGFYVDESAEYVKEWYGPVVTKFIVKPEAKVLLASIDTNDSQLFKAVLSNEKKLLKARGNPEKLDEISKLLKKNQIEWVHAVDRYAEENKYDIVKFSKHEIVVKNCSMLEVDND